jgi:6-phosphogluconolactonase
VASFAVEGFNVTAEIKRIRFSGHGAYAPLQSSPHPHQVVQHPHKPWLYVSDLGADRYVFACSAKLSNSIHVLDLDRTGDISLSSSAPTPPAFGPRHVAFHPRGNVLYSIGEIGCGVTTYEINQSNGSLTSVVTVSTLPPGLDPTTAGLNVGSARGVMAGGESFVQYITVESL